MHRCNEANDRDDEKYIRHEWDENEEEAEAEDKKGCFERCLVTEFGGTIRDQIFNPGGQVCVLPLQLHHLLLQQEIFIGTLAVLLLQLLHILLLSLT